MKRISILLILALLCWLPFGFAQTPGAVPEKQDPLKDSIDKYFRLRQYRKVLPFTQKMLSNLEKRGDTAGVEMAQALFYQGEVLSQLNRFEDAILALNKSISIKLTYLGANHPDIGKLYRRLSYNYFLANRQKDEELCLLNSLEIWIESKNDSLIKKTYDELRELYTRQGNLPKEEFYLIAALELQKKRLGKAHLKLAGYYKLLGHFYSKVGKYMLAEQNYLEAEEIDKRVYGEFYHILAASYYNRGIMFSSHNQSQKSEDYFRKGLKVFRYGLLTKDPKVYYNNGKFAGSKIGGLLNWKLGNYFTADSLFTFDPNPLHKFPVDTFKVFSGDWYRDLTEFYTEKGDLNQAEQLGQKSLKLCQKFLGNFNKDLSDSYLRLGKVYLLKGVLHKAETNFKIYWDLSSNQIQNYFPHLSDSEKNLFYENNKNQLDELKSFCLLRYHSNPMVTETFFNVQISGKAQLQNSSAKWKHRIKTAGDKKLNRLFDEWETNQNKLNKLFQSTDSTELAGLDSLQAKTEKMEKELSLRSENFAKLADKKLINWKDVQKALKPGEAAVEIVRVKKFGISKTVTDTSDPKKPVYQVKGLTDTIYYAALIVKPESTIPEMVILKNGNDMEGKYLKYYQNLIKNKLDDNKSYQQFWQKIGARLEGSKRIYFSPDGVYHNLNLNTLFNPKTKKFLLEEKDIRIVTVTKDIVNPSPAEEDNKLAELVGFPSYYTNQTGQIAAVSERKSPELIYGLSLKSTCSLAELPGTKTEVDKIAGILNEKGWEVKNYTGESAIEENIKESYKPRLLHIATHGFFQPDTTKGSNPLLRSGLMLAGAGNTLKGEKNETGEDGILTAYEAMNLNLDNTDLVVLSACETGLGEIKNGEGVYGLQRAFKVAGAKSIIMSLWKVSDQATQELMVRFYKNWLGTASDGSKQSVRMNKRAAFLKAQKELKAKYPNPYYWGAFVMVGE